MLIKQTPIYEVSTKNIAAELTMKLHELARKLAGNKNTAYLEPETRQAAHIACSIYKSLRQIECHAPKSNNPSTNHVTTQIESR